MSVESVVLANEDLFDLPPAAVAARGVVAELEQLQELVGGAPEPLSAESLGYQLYNRMVRSGTAPTAAELAEIADDSRAAAARRAADVVATMVHHARETFEKAVKAGAADYIAQLVKHRANLFAEVRELGSAPTTAEAAIKANDVIGFQRLQALVERDRRICSLHAQLIGDVVGGARAFLDTTVPPDASELQYAERRMLTPGGPTDAAARLRWLAQSAPFLVPDAKTATRMFEEWRRSLTQYSFDSAGKQVWGSR